MASGPETLSAVLKAEMAAIWPASPVVGQLDAAFTAARQNHAQLRRQLEQSLAAAHAARRQAEADLKQARTPAAEQAAELRAREAEEDQHNAEEALRGLDHKLELVLRSAYYEAAHRLDPPPAALALSGGGIRSASFCLGVLQALAEARLLERFHYLSTVSGGGYIGSWLSAWLHWRKDAEAVMRELQPRRNFGDEEPAPIRHLREHSSYLTPRLGLLSADLWTAVAIIFRNLLLNWLILLPAIALPIVAIKIAAGVAHTARFDGLWPGIGALVAVLGLTAAGISFGYKLYKLYLKQRPRPAIREQFQSEQLRFLWASLLPAIVAGAAFSWLANHWRTAAGALALWVADWRGYAPLADASLWQLPLMVALAVLVYLSAALGARVAAALTGQSLRWQAKDLVCWVAAAVVTGTLLWLAVYAFAALSARQIILFPLECLTEHARCADRLGDEIVWLDPQLVLVVFGMPWFLLAMLLGQMTYVLVNSFSREGDFEREWLGRAGGWYVIAALAWIGFATLALLGSVLYDGAQLALPHAQKWLAGLGTLTGAVTALLGRSEASPGRGAPRGWKGMAVNLGLALAGPLFICILLIFISMAFDAAAFGTRMQHAAIFVADAPDAAWLSDWGSVAAITLALIVVMVWASTRVNVNRFSMHALYRNRLIRAFLGGPHGEERRGNGSVGARRRPDRFIDFDTADNPQAKDLWPTDGPTGRAWRPFHIVNIALNLAASGNLAWQQRKAESFIVTAKHCGAASLGYRQTGEYGHPEAGISLGTAMAISGAAVSPNMGYHSSPVIAFLLTLFNVRLGWWLGNPGRAGERPGSDAADKQPYRRESPGFALRPLLSELFGLAGASSPYVYLSDGGHFENLGVYEMVRRRCRWIVVVDAGEDIGRGFDDLGNLVRKAWIDLGVRISFESSSLLGAAADATPARIPYYALGSVEYLSEENAPVGRILYIKPGVRGSEAAADVIAYARANGEFPHQSTGDQWFDEPQLESYRRLGYHIMSRIVDAATHKAKQAPAGLAELFQSLETVLPKSVQ